ncbi:MAG: hypothetical protein HY912_17640 [Desulfomonile tiedjei]|uniref:Uncharacterized protein n=1 Tax=Desulfomonile tiedjei TaxID=2358 RepID=A0A9D6V3A9_9BACT|nr:hypothetical protein [Desulfomonile tiedjei]
MSAAQLIIRATGLGIFAAATGYLLLRKYGPQPSDFAAAAIHFRNGVHELQKGVGLMIFGSEPTEEQTRKERESNRIIID